MDPKTNPLLPEEEIPPVYRSLETPHGVFDSDNELIKRFRRYFNTTWIDGYVNISLFYHETATNSGAETYHKSLKTYIKSSHPNIWKFMQCLNNVISDNDLELQRLLNGHANTRVPNATTRDKQIRRNQCKDKYLNGSYTAVDYLNAISMTIGHASINAVLAPGPFETSDNLGDISDDMNQDNSSQCHVCLLPRVTNFALLHDNYVHGGFCEACANQLLNLKVTCPICRENIKGVLQIFQSCISQIDTIFPIMQNLYFSIYSLHLISYQTVLH